MLGNTESKLSLLGRIILTSSDNMNLSKSHAHTVLMRRTLLTAVIITAGFLVPNAKPVFAAAKKKVVDLPNFSQVASGIFRGGQPTKEGLEKLKSRGIKTVVSLRHNRNQVVWEAQQVKSLGLTFKRLPMDGLHKPSPATIKQFLSIVQEPANQPVFVHCEFGQDRTGTLIAIYREEAQNWPAKKAYDEMVDLGFEKKYVWLADSVFDYEEDKLETVSDERPMNVKLLDSVERTFSLRRKTKVD